MKFPPDTLGLHKKYRDAREAERKLRIAPENETMSEQVTRQIARTAAHNETQVILDQMRAVPINHQDLLATIDFPNGRIFNIEVFADLHRASGTRPGSTTEIGGTMCTIGVSAEDVFDHECDEPDMLAQRIVQTAERSAGQSFPADQYEKLVEKVHGWLCEHRRMSAESEDDEDSA